MADFKLCVLASGGGTNLQAIIDKLHGSRGITVAGVASDKPEAKALRRARDADIETAVFVREEYADREARDEAIGDWVERIGTELIVLAGYMQLLSASFVARFRGRIINVHPALLPSFPGLHAVQQALDHGVKTTGVTVHFVDEGVDSGPIILQQAIEVPPDREWQTLEDAIHATEHALYPEAIRLIAEGRVTIDPSNPRIVSIL